MKYLLIGFATFALIIAPSLLLWLGLAHGLGWEYTLLPYFVAVIIGAMPGLLTWAAYR